MGKTKLFAVVLCLLVLLAGCGGVPGGSTPSGGTKVNAESQESQQDSSSEEAESGSDAPASKTSSVEKLIFDKSGVMEETALLDENDLKVTATGITYGDSRFSIDLTLENNTDSDVTFYSNTMGGAYNSVNGYMIDDGYLNCDVGAGKKAKDTLDFSYDSLLLFGITKVADIEIGLRVCDGDYNEIVSRIGSIKTDLADSYDYDAAVYQNAIVSELGQLTYRYTVPYFKAETLYDQNQVSIVSAGIMKNRDGEEMLLLEAVNDSDESICLNISNINLNNVAAYDYTWSSDFLNPGKHKVISIRFDNLLDKSFRETYGIGEIGSVEFLVSLTNAESDKIGEDEKAAVSISEVSPPNEEGEEIYNEGGVRVISKGLTQGDGEYDDDLYLLLLAENTSGKELSVDCKYNSFSANGYMLDMTQCSDKKIESGKYGAVVIKMYNSSLEETDIAEIADITEIEFGLEIKDGHDMIGEKTVTLNF